jgi:rod shape-determining protein MreD
MLPPILAILFLGLATMLQTTIVINLRFLYGAADLVLLTLLGWSLHANVEGRFTWAVVAGLLVGFVSEQPIWLTTAAYVSIMALAEFLQRRIWEIELLTLFTTTLAGSLLIGVLTVGFRLIVGTPLPLAQTFNLVLLPSALLNLLFILPVYAVLGEVAKSFYPVEADV